MSSSSSRHAFISLDDTQPRSEDASRNPFASDADKFNSRVEEAMKHWHVPGLAFAIVDGHHITSHGYGVARVSSNSNSESENDVPLVTPDTIFDIASMSKSFTAAAMALLVQDTSKDAVQWTAPVARLVPELTFSDAERTKNVTVEDILSHRTGLQGHEESVRGVKHSTPDTPASIVRNMRNLPFNYPLVTKYQYNNLLYTCAAHMVEELSGKAFDEILRDKFWTPLGMDRTFLGADNVLSSEQDGDKVAQGSIYNPSLKKLVPLSHTPEPEGIGAGGIQSTAPSIARWIHAQIHRLPPLSSDSYAHLANPRIFADDPPSGTEGLSKTYYALGWEVEWYKGTKIVKHDGSWAGFVSTMWYVPEKKWGFVMLGNSEDAGCVENEVGWHLLDTLLGVPEAERFDWRAYWVRIIDKGRVAKSVKELFPEREEHLNDEPRMDPDLRSFAGRYENTGYHDIELTYNAEEERLEVDCSDRSYAFLLHIKERAYGYWYVCEWVGPESGEKSAMKCTFEVDRKGKAKRFGVELYTELGDLVWFERIGGGRDERRGGGGYLGNFFPGRVPGM